ncbi:hypothetical protein P7L95_09835 [Bisgaard Taxon 10/6]|uniref:hypothetical protein n=1 Tax=Exercitatus varius TaxID=67857 RepID=UPI00294B4618|nr:hypothetical protein [Exercitatus varius]MDG2957041.1 hypothetical protein [Exercitatus varius]MDG2965271.1 hypothetical protein [Exercitatus varius]
MMKLKKVFILPILLGLSLTACKEELKDYSGIYERQEGNVTFITELEKTQKENIYTERFRSKREDGTERVSNVVRTVKVENGEVYELSGHLRAKITDTTYTQINNGDIYTKVAAPQN